MIINKLMSFFIVPILLVGLFFVLSDTSSGQSLDLGCGLTPNSQCFSDPESFPCMGDGTFCQVTARFCAGNPALCDDSLYETNNFCLEQPGADTCVPNGCCTNDEGLCLQSPEIGCEPPNEWIEAEQGEPSPCDEECAGDPLGCCQLEDDEISCEITTFSVCVNNGDSIFWKAGYMCTEGMCGFPAAPMPPVISPIISPIPTISQWGLIAMAGILGIVGFIMVIRKRKVSA